MCVCVCVCVCALQAVRSGVGGRWAGVEQSGVSHNNLTQMKSLSSLQTSKTRRQGMLEVVVVVVVVVVIMMMIMKTRREKKRRRMV